MNTLPKEIILINHFSKFFDKSHIIKKKNKYFINHQSLFQLCPINH
jgi:hypothetical protein